MEQSVRQLWWYAMALLLLLGVFGEVCLLTSCRDRWGQDTSSIVLFIASFVVGAVLLILSFIPAPAPRTPRKYRPGWVSIAAWVFVVVLLALPVIQAAWHKFPVDYSDPSQSDIIPQIYVLLDRFWHGINPYLVINEWGYDLSPTYLPFTWLPFSVPYALGLDFRMYAFGLFLIGVVVSIKYWQPGWIGIFVGCAYLFLWLRMVAIFDDIVYGVTVEWMIAGCYLLFLASWRSRSVWFQALTLSACLLSRYALIFWLPMFALYLWNLRSRKHVLKGMAIVAGTVLVLYVLPFWLRDPGSFTRGLAHHQRAALAEWHGQPWQDDMNKPYTLYKGVGLANRFFESSETPVENRLKRLQRTQIALLMGWVALSMLLYWRTVRKMIHPTYFVWGSFKIYLALFYHLLQLPYTYLFVVLVAINIPILVRIFRDRGIVDQATLPVPAPTPTV
ncbi:MAG TPA: hypothetical protein P5275_20820 [Saprospiraceae bacterium]|nr:hypothetical protein [Saprospiraceae bacterium]